MDFFSEFLAENPVLVSLYHGLEGAVILLDIFFIIVFVISFRGLWHLRPTFVYTPRRWQKYLKKKPSPQLKTPVVTTAWSKIQSKVKDGSADSLRLAVVEADGIVDEVLKRMGLAGETFADRLEHMNPERYGSIERLWDAHRLRNNLVHTPDFHATPNKMEEALHNYEAFLKEVKAL